MKVPHYYQQVYSITQKIPQGSVTTYGLIARLIGKGNARVVGTALHKNPHPIRTPCHRVVNKEGKVADKFGFGGSAKQRKLLESEGIFFENGKVPLNKYLWIPD